MKRRKQERSEPHKYVPRFRMFGRYQMKIVSSYLVVVAIVLVLLNTYPLYMTQTIVFQYKQRAMSTEASLYTSDLNNLEQLTQETVYKVLAPVDDRSYRVVVCNEYMQVVYDNSTRESAMGRFLLYPEIAQALSGSDVFASEFQNQAFESRATMPVMNKNRFTGVIYLYDYDTEQGSLLIGLQTQLTTFSVGITVILLLISMFISIMLTRRFPGILQAIHAVRDGDYSTKAPVHGKDELAELAIQFNLLSTRLQRTEALRQQFVSDASHELKTPLASVRLLADNILQTEDMDKETLREFITDIGDEIDRLTRMTEKLMHLTRMEGLDQPPDKLLYPERVVSRAVHMLTPFAQARQVEIICELDKDSVICGESDDLYLIIYNLMENAVKYNNTGGRVRVYLYTREPEVTVIVDDNGIGIPKADLPRIFERFYRVDKTRSRAAGGTGLGLAVVEQTLLRMGGMIRVDSTVGQGTRFTLTFPVVTEPVKDGEAE